jgi:hypothetical protein
MMMRRALWEASELASGWLSGAVAGVAALLSAILAAFVDPIAGAIALTVTLVGLAAIFVYALMVKARFEGPYVVIGNDVTWDLTGRNGEVAKISNHRHVRFNYRCTVIVDRVYDMPRGTIETLKPDYGTPISSGIKPKGEYAIVELRADRQRNEEHHLTYQLTMANGFSKPEQCWIEHAPIERTKKAELDVVFPAEHRPTDVTLLRESNGRTEDLKQVGGWEDNMKSALWEEGGRVHFRLRERPKRGETYRLDWKWEG